jgi:hypothetical protein
MTKTFVIIPCGGAKLDKAAPARELYTGSMFRDQLATALTMTTPDRIRILSAKHGLLELDQIVEPYDVKMGSGDDISVSSVAHQLDTMTGGPFDAEIRIEALLPKKYAAVLEAARGFYPIVNHFAGTAGIGYQKAVLRKIRNTKES